MLIAARWILVALLAAVLVRLHFRRVPVFCLYVAAALLALAGGPF